MQITYTGSPAGSTASASFLLCRGRKAAGSMAGSVTSGPEEFSKEVTREVQVARYPRANDAALFARGNRTRTISFTVLTSFANAQGAENFVDNHEAELPERGVLMIVSNSGFAFTFTRWEAE